MSEVRFWRNKINKIFKILIFNFQWKIQMILWTLWKINQAQIIIKIIQMKIIWINNKIIIIIIIFKIDGFWKKILFE